MPNKQFSIGFTGDMSFSGYFAGKHEDDQVISKEIKEFLSVNDVNIINYESPITTCAVTEKKRLAHRSPLAVLEFVKKYIPNCVLSFANNHMLDYSTIGVIDSIANAHEKGVPFIGIGRDIEEAVKPVIVGNDSIKIAVFAIQYKPHRVKKENRYVAPLSEAVADYLHAKIKEVRAAVDKVVVVYHGGKEFSDVPFPKTKKLLREYLDYGADVIVAHHPHVVQGYELIGKKAIFYSLGNFVFDTDFQRAQLGTEAGMLLRLNFNGEEVTFDNMPVLIDRAANRVVRGEENANFCQLKDVGAKRGWIYRRKKQEDIRNRRNKQRCVFLKETRGKSIDEYIEFIKARQQENAENFDSDEYAFELEYTDFEALRKLLAKKTRKMKVYSGQQVREYNLKETQRIERKSQKEAEAAAKAEAERGIWEKEIRKMKNLPNRYIYIELAAQQKGLTYAEAKEEMDEIKKEHDISYREYAANKLYACGTEASLNQQIKRIENERKRQLEKICADTGWSFEKAKEESDRIKKKFGLTYKKIAGYSFFACTDEEISARLKKWEEKAEYHRQVVMKETGWSREQVVRHITRYHILYDILPDYYVCYKAWRLNDEQMDSYARQKNSAQMFAKYNKGADWKKLSDKYEFDKIYKDYINRKFWVNVDTDFDEFKEFTDGVEDIFCKPVSSGGGIGAERYIVPKDEKSLRELYDMLMSRTRILVEECVHQHPAIDQFLPGCVNTVRAVTIVHEGKTEIICTGIRFGYHGVTDNFSNDGMVCDVDKETGIIVTPAVNKKGDVFEKHPITGIPFVGFQIPNWDKVIETAKKAMDVLPGVNYVGWDLAVCEDKVAIIEGNSQPDLVLVQAPYAPVMRGMRYLFDPYLENRCPPPEGTASNDKTIQQIATILGIDYERARKKTAQATRLFGFSLQEYYTKKYYCYTNYQLLEKLCVPSEGEYLDAISAVVCMRTKMDSDQARQRVKDISARYNLSYATIMLNSYYKCTDEKIRELLGEGSSNKNDQFALASLAKKANCTLDLAVCHVRQLQERFHIDLRTVIQNNYFGKSNKDIFEDLEKRDGVKLNTLAGRAQKAKIDIREFYKKRALLTTALGSGLEPFYDFNLVSRTLENANTFLGFSDMRYLMGKYTKDKRKRSLLNNKKLFAEHFGEKLGRKIWCNEAGATFASFVEFCEGCETVVAKPLDGIMGRGVQKITVAKENLQDVFAKLMDSPPMIVEEYIVQHNVLAQFGAGSVNTLRIVTIFEKDLCIPVYAFLRIGNSDTVDNFHGGGNVANVNIKTGVIESDAITHTGAALEKDSYSGAVVKGTQIPYWDDVIALVKSAGEQIKDVGFVGWDVAVTERGPVLVEGNSNSYLALYEYTFAEKPEGHRYLLKEYLDE